jgi:hypothetical protein
MENSRLPSEWFVIDALGVKSPCFSESMHKLPLRPIHRLKSKPHRRPSKKSAEGLLNLKTPTLIIAKVVQSGNGISTSHMSWFMEGGRRIDIECLGEFPIAFRPSTQVGAWELLETAGLFG